MSLGVTILERQARTKSSGVHKKLKGCVLVCVLKKTSYCENAGHLIAGTQGILLRGHNMRLVETQVMRLAENQEIHLVETQDMGCVEREDMGFVQIRYKASAFGRHSLWCLVYWRRAKNKS